MGAEKHWSGVQLLQCEAQASPVGESEEGECLEGDKLTQSDYLR